MTSAPRAQALIELRPAPAICRSGPDRPNKCGGPTKQIMAHVCISTCREEPVQQSCFSGRLSRAWQVRMQGSLSGFYLRKNRNTAARGQDRDGMQAAASANIEIDLLLTRASQAFSRRAEARRGCSETEVSVRNIIQQSKLLRQQRTLPRKLDCTEA